MNRDLNAGICVGYRNRSCAINEPNLQFRVLSDQEKPVHIIPDE